jgi:hypothetical protein
MHCVSVVHSHDCRPTPADKRTLFRRACFDLIGLPTTPDPMNAFLSGASPNAYEKPVGWLPAIRGIDRKRLTFRHNGIERRLTDVFGDVIHPILA